MTAPATPEGQKDLPFKSAKISCSQNDDGSIAIVGKAYMSSSSCGGVAIPVKTTIAAGCQDGGKFTCVPDLTDAVSVNEKWSAIGAYFGDSACGHADAVAAFTPNTCVAMVGKKTGSVQIDDNGSSYEGKVWEGPTDCLAAPKKEVTIPKNTCQPINTQVSGSTYALAVDKFSQIISKAVGEHKDLEAIHSFESAFKGRKGSGATVYYYGATADTVPM